MGKSRLHMLIDVKDEKAIARSILRRHNFEGKIRNKTHTSMNDVYGGFYIYNLPIEMSSACKA